MRYLSNSLKALALFAVIVGADYANAQCDAKKFRKQCKDGLGAYIFETASSKGFNEFAEPRKMIDAAFSVYAQESYRVLNLCDGFSAPVEFHVYDSERRELFNNSSDLSKNKYDFTADKTGDYVIRFKFSENSNPSACVSFAIGYK